MDEPSDCTAEFHLFLRIMNVSGTSINFNISLKANAGKQFNIGYKNFICTYRYSHILLFKCQGHIFNRVFWSWFILDYI